MTNKTNIRRHLLTLGLNSQEAQVYLTLNKEPQNHLKLSRSTSINRTSIYRIVDSLLQRGFIERVAGDRGLLLQACEPETLERIVRETENKAAEQKQALKFLSSELLSPQVHDDFTVKTYESKDGLKKMLWNELSTKGEILIFSHGEPLDSAFGKKFANSFRKEIIERKIRQRALQNEKESVESYTDLPYEPYYKWRVIPPKILKISQELTILEDRVNVYNWEKGIFVGSEIRNRGYAQFMRTVFEVFWKQALSFP